MMDNRKSWNLFLIAVGLVLVSLSYSVQYPILNIITGLAFIILGIYRLKRK